jgi:coatomer subunit beta'
VWQLGSNVPNFTLAGHEKGVNAIDFFQVCVGASI